MSHHTLLFLWENFGPMHIDRCEALARALSGRFTVAGAQWTGKSAVYGWEAGPTDDFHLTTLFPDRSPASLSSFAKFWTTLLFCLRTRRTTFFFSHYNDPAIIAVAWILKLTGRPLFGMALSKFDDYQDRRIGYEFLKSFALWPYAGFLTNRGRASSYLQFLTNGRARCVPGHNTLSVEEIRRLAGAPPAPGGLPHAERSFVAITRLVPKKNLFMLLDAYARYRAGAERPHPLRICGDGPLESDLRARIAALGLDEAVHITGFIQRPAIARELAGALALVLPSVEEQFGNVIIEAQAMGVPCLVSENCGARETLIRTGVNGFLIEPDNPEGLARLMGWIESDEALWRDLADGCATTVARCDTPAFVEGVKVLVGETGARLGRLLPKA